MAIDPGEIGSNEAARRAFGYEPAPPPPPGAPNPAAPSEQQLADWWTRAGAFVLDQIVVIGIAVIAAVVAILVVGDPASDTTTEIIVYAVAIPAGFLYAPLLMMRRGERNGQTLGKQAVGIRVIRTTGEPVSFWNGFLRTAIAQQLLIAITFYVYAVLDYLWPLRDPQNQALHDKIARTWVIRTTAAATGEPAVSIAPTAWQPPTADERPVQGWLPPSSGG